LEHWFNRYGGIDHENNSFQSRICIFTLNGLFSELGGLVVSFFDMIKTVPNVVWSGVIAACIAASVTLLGIRKNNQHDAVQRRINRELDLKREVYLEAIDSISKGIYRISKISSFNMGDNFNQLTEGMESEIASSLKVLMVGSNETFERGSELINLMNSKLLDLISMNTKNYFLDQKFKIEVSFLTNEVEKIFKQVNLETQKYQKRMELLTEVTKAVEEINQKALGVIISIRKELNMPVDEKTILEIGRKNLQDSRDMLKRSKDNMAKELSDFLEFIRETSKKYVPSEQESICKENVSNPTES